MDTKLAGVIALFKQAWVMYRGNFWGYLALAFIPALAGALIAIAVTVGLVGVIFSSALNSGTVMTVVLASITLVIVLAAIAGAIYVQILSSVAMLVQARDGGKYSILDALKNGKAYVKNYFFTSLLSGATTLGAGAILLLPILILLGLLSGVFDLDPLIPEFGYEIGMLIAWVMIGLLLIPALIVGIWLSMVGFIVVNEPSAEGVASVLVRSKQLVTNHWWPVFWRTLAPAILFIIISAILGGPESNSDASPRSLFSQFVTLLLSPLIMLYMFNLYKQLVAMPVVQIDEVKTKKYFSYLAFFGVIIFIPLVIAITIVFMSL